MGNVYRWKLSAKPSEVWLSGDKLFPSGDNFNLSGDNLLPSGDN
jgi:hypothetical protein